MNLIISRKKLVYIQNINAGSLVLSQLIKMYYLGSLMLLFIYLIMLCFVNLHFTVTTASQNIPGGSLVDDRETIFHISPHFRFIVVLFIHIPGFLFYLMQLNYMQGGGGQ